MAVGVGSSRAGVTATLVTNARAQSVGRLLLRVLLSKHWRAARFLRPIMTSQEQGHPLSRWRPSFVCVAPPATDKCVQVLNT